MHKKVSVARATSQTTLESLKLFEILGEKREGAKN